VRFNEAGDPAGIERLGIALEPEADYERRPDGGGVRSTFDVPAEQRAAIQNALNETFSAEIRVRFETAPDLISGIELTTNGQKVAWSIADYLVSLEKGVDDLLKEKDKPEAKAKPKPESNSEVRSETQPKQEPEESKPGAKSQ